MKIFKARVTLRNDLLRTCTNSETLIVSSLRIATHSRDYGFWEVIKEQETTACAIEVTNCKAGSRPTLTAIDGPGSGRCCGVELISQGNVGEACTAEQSAFISAPTSVVPVRNYPGYSEAVGP